MGIRITAATYEMPASAKYYTDIIQPVLDIIHPWKAADGHN